MALREQILGGDWLKEREDKGKIKKKGLVMGLLFGIIFGVAFDSIALGISLGVAFGVTFSNPSKRAE